MAGPKEGILTDAKGRIGYVASKLNSNSMSVGKLLKKYGDAESPARMRGRSLFLYVHNPHDQPQIRDWRGGVPKGRFAVSQQMRTVARAEPKNGILTDAKGRIGYITSNFIFSFNN
ncbi:hypothetical protein V8F20_004353 [Naviculisporaceae sp. PSN 640]